MTYHNVRDANGKFTSKKSKAKAKPKKKAVAKKAAKKKPSRKKKEVKKTDIIGIVLDTSGSMNHILDTAIEIVNQRIKSFKDYAGNEKQPCYITTTLFASEVLMPRENDYHENIRPIHRRNCPHGATALHEAVCRTMESMEEFGERIERNGDDVAYLMIVVTDGWENDSSPKYAGKMGKYIQERQDRGNWSVGVMCPPNSVRVVEQQGVPLGNISPWEATKKGVEKVRRMSDKAVGAYHGGRAKGQTRSTSLFVDMSTVKKKDIKKMKDVSKTLKSWTVDAECSISEFVNDKLSSRTVARQVGGSRYETGRAFYELTKRETIQDYKGVIVMDKDTNKMYSGKEARQLVGLPDHDAKVSPHNLGVYKIFVESTSTNRKLVRGTTLLYAKK